MKSAYLILGLPGNASAQDIEQAFERVRQIYTPQRLAGDESTLDKFNEAKMAYDVLRNPEFRAAHDRKLAAAQRPKPMSRPIRVVEEESGGRKLLRASIWVVALIFAGAMFISYKNAEARRQQAALELAAKQQAAKEEEQQRVDAQRLEQERAQQKAKAEADDRRFALEGQAAGARVAAERARQESAGVQMQRMALAEAQRQEAAQRAQEQRNAADARRRTEMDKQRVRELCYQNYRRPDC